MGSSGRQMRLVGLVSAVLVAAGAVRVAAAACVQPPADVNGDGVSNVTDVQCSILAALWSLSQAGGTPSCVAGGDVARADLTCDGQPNVVDVQLAIQIVLGLPLSADVDADGNLCADACESAPGPAAGELVVTEVMVNPKHVSDAVGEWFEVHNASDHAISLAGLVVRDDGTDWMQLPQAGAPVLAPGAYFVFGRYADPAVNGGVNVDWVLTGTSLANSGDEVVLESGGVEIDRVVWDDGTAYAQSVGVAMSLDPVWGTAATNDDPAYWCAAKQHYNADDLGSPGAPNPPCAQCGNGAVELGEECDDGTANSDSAPGACRTDCTLPTCGDGVCDPDENCLSCAGDCGPCGVPLCGGTRCRADQECVAGQCRFACQGVHVPGDYATIQGAIDALEPVGGTICIADGTWVGNLSLNPEKPLTLQGADDDLVTIDGTITLSSPWSASGTITLRGMTVLGGVHVSDPQEQTPVVLEALRIRSTTGPALRVLRSGEAIKVTVDGCDIAGPPDDAAVAVDNQPYLDYGSTAHVEVRNSFLHDSAVGLRVRDIGASGKSPCEVRLTNCTLLDNTTGLDSVALHAYLSMYYYNNIVGGSATGIRVDENSLTTVGHGYNAVWDNGVNYELDAVPGTGYVHADPLLDYTAVPPEPSAASPLIGAADGTKAPSVDYWGETRDATPDIGAVEAWCPVPPCEAQPAGTCGDGTCGGAENCATCPQDCGACDPAACATPCRADQYCIAGECRFLCDGVHVPGDYATIQDAIDALGPVGGTICIGDGTWTGNLSLNPHKSLTLQGADDDLVTIDGTIAVESPWSASGTIALRGMTVLGGVHVSDPQEETPVVLEALRIRSTSGPALRVLRSGEAIQVTVDGCDVAGPSDDAAVAVDNQPYLDYGGTAHVVVRNSFLHDSSVGLRVRDVSASGKSPCEVRLTNCTLLDNTTGLDSTNLHAYLSLYYYNNIIGGSATGIRVDENSLTTVGHGYNALWDNGVNFEWDAAPGLGYVQADPMLDYTTVPPSPSAASPLIGAADETEAPSLDYWGETRDATPDIGAVEVQCANPPCVAQPVGTCGDGTCGGAENCATCPQDCGACDPTACATPCRADQYCIAGECRFLCDGVHVPGDYATIQDAIDALEPVGGTICIADGTWTGDLSLNPEKTLTLQGADDDLVTIDGAVTVESPWSANGNIVLRGMTVLGGIDVSDPQDKTPVVLEALRIRSTTGPALRVLRSGEAIEVTVDGCDIAGPPDDAAVAVDNQPYLDYGGTAHVEVRNSFLHDSAVGLRVRDIGASGKSPCEVRLTNCTLLDNTTGIDSVALHAYLSLYYHNNIVGGSATGIRVDDNALTTVGHGYNALWDNGVNYELDAVPGTGYVTADPLLDYTVVPPAPTASSPLVGAADPTQAPATDYWAAPRDATPDIGAVERQP